MGRIRTHPSTVGDEGALAAVLPAWARVVAGPAADNRALGPDTGSTDPEPDVLLAEAVLPERASTAPVVVLSLMSTPRLLDGGSRAADAVLRCAAWAQAGSRSAAAERRLRTEGFADIRVFRWDHRQPFPLPGHPPSRVRLWHAHRYPRRAVLLASRLDPAPSILDAALADANIAAPDQVLASEAALIVLTESTVLRVAVGGGRGQVLRPVWVSAALRRAEPDAVLADRVPWIAAHGTSGLGAWSAERRLPGTRAVPPLSQSMLDQCCDVLIELFRVGGRVERSGTCQADAEVISTAVPPDVAAAADRLAAAADRALADLPAGFGHGDFWYDNLLVDSGRLTGVLDWDSAGSSRPPLVDLLHLQLSARRPVPGYGWGAAVLDELRPWVDNGGDSLSRRYLSELGLAPPPAALRALLIAYWLDWLRYQFDRYADRRARSRWVTNNIVRVARTLDAAGWARPSHRRSR